MFRILGINISRGRTPATGNEIVLGGIDRNPVDPRIEGTVATESANGAIGLDEGLLCHIHGLVRIVHIAIDQLDNLALVFQHQDVKRLLLALLYPFYQRLIYASFAHPGRLPSTRNYSKRPQRNRIVLCYYMKNMYFSVNKGY